MTKTKTTTTQRNTIDYDINGDINLNIKPSHITRLVNPTSNKYNRKGNTIRHCYGCEEGYNCKNCKGVCVLHNNFIQLLNKHPELENQEHLNKKYYKHILGDIRVLVPKEDETSKKAKRKQENREIHKTDQDTIDPSKKRDSEAPVECVPKRHKGDKRLRQRKVPITKPIYPKSCHSKKYQRKEREQKQKEDKVEKESLGCFYDGVVVPQYEITEMDQFNRDHIKRCASHHDYLSESCDSYSQDESIQDIPNVEESDHIDSQQNYDDDFMIIDKREEPDQAAPINEKEDEEYIYLEIDSSEESNSISQKPSQESTDSHRARRQKSNKKLRRRCQKKLESIELPEEELSLKENDRIKRIVESDSIVETMKLLSEINSEKLPNTISRFSQKMHTNCSSYPNRSLLRNALFKGTKVCGFYSHRTGSAYDSYKEKRQAKFAKFEDMNMQLNDVVLTDFQIPKVISYYTDKHL